MKTDRTVESIEFEISRTDAIRMLGMHRKKRLPRISIQDCFEEEYAVARELVDARVVWRWLDEGLAGSTFVNPSIPCALAVCTIGPALEERVSSLIAAGDSARAMILDAIGSSATEGTADECNGHICHRAIRAGMTPDMRRSPGYGGWDILEQRAIFSSLDPGEIGVSLNDDCMMAPHKSISFLVPLEGGSKIHKSGGRCTRCGFIQCEFREQ
jgi:hypothetical protein